MKYYNKLASAYTIIGFILILAAITSQVKFNSVTKNNSPDIVIQTDSIKTLIDSTTFDLEKIGY